MKNSLLLLLICLPLHLLAQDDPVWAPDGATWYYTQIRPGAGTVSIGYAMLESMGDTIIHDTLARVIKHSVHLEFEPVDRPPIYIYQEGQKVYYFLNNRFSLLYDFTAQVGDTLEILAPAYEYEFEEDSIMYFRVVSTQQVNLAGIQIKQQYLDPIDKGASNFAVQFSGWNTELMGNQQFFLPVNHVVCDHTCPEGLRCYADAEITQKFVGFPCDTGDFLVSTRDGNSSGISLDIFPNPASDIISIDLHNLPDKQQEIYYAIYDVRGKVIYEAETLDVNTGQIPFSLANGTYFVRLWTNKWVAARKFMVVRN